MTSILILGYSLGRAQELPTQASNADVKLHLASTLPGKQRPLPEVAWLVPLSGTPSVPFESRNHYTLIQKNRTFTPHLLVIPVGSAVQFPNEDPFFHNVFSLFDGKRFDLGLYEAGSSKSVTFSKEGVSYIFCDIHPDMSAVIMALSTPLYAIADTQSNILIRDVPPGDYELHFWIEGLSQQTLLQLQRRMHIQAGLIDLGIVKVALPKQGDTHHKDMFGKNYDTDSHPTY